MSEKQTLDQLAPGESGVITSVGDVPGAVRRRLIDMGLTPGTRVLVKKIAPFGDPLEVMVRGFELSLRRGDASKIAIGEPPARRARSERRYGGGRRRVPDPETARRMDLKRHDHHSNHEHHERSESRRKHAEHSPSLTDSASISIEEQHRNEREMRSKYPAPPEHDLREMKIALAGNPNSGKTTLFNALTGSDQYVGNWPGVTVEKKEGHAKTEEHKLTIVDLPGIYSLSPYSLEEIVARDFIIGERPDAIINIVDATNLERNMYLTVQLLELERPMVLALNFMDEVRARGDSIDLDALSQKLGIPVVPISARSGENVELLLQVTHRQLHTGYTLEPDDLYDDHTHEIHHRVGELIQDEAETAHLPAHWASIKLLEGDSIVENALRLSEEKLAALAEIAAEYAKASPFGDRETLVADSRYGYIEDVTAAVLTRGQAPETLSVSDKIDKIVTHKVLAVPVFMLAMFLIFSITFGAFGSMLSDGVGGFMEDVVGSSVTQMLERGNVQPWLISLSVDGVIAGVGGVLTFLPQIALLFFFLSLLEDTGYMARAAFIMDRLLRRFGLSGKAFIPMLMGFGCTVPAVMGARTMESEKDRRMTIMLVPFMSCSAKLPVYGLIASAFFGERAGIVVFALYMLGMLMAIGSGLALKNTLFKGETAPFVLELPPYRVPTLNNTLRHVWERVRDFLVRAGTVIFLMSVVLWLLQTFDLSMRMVEDSSDSMLGAIGGAIAPMFRPMGYGTWQASVALLTGLIAKEAVVASLSMFYNFPLTAESGVVAAALGSTFATGLSAFAFLVFILLYVPCLAAVSAIHREMNSLKWTLISVGWQLGSAYIVSLLVYQLGGLLGLG